MKLTTKPGLRSEIFVPTRPAPVFAPLQKALKDCRVGFVTTGGIHIKSQTPFNTAGDYSYRQIPTDIDTNELMVTHGGFDNSDINKDVNAMLPLDRMRELVKKGFIGGLTEHFIGIMGGGGSVNDFKDKTGPEVAKLFKDEGADIVLLTGGCGTCHRSCTIVARAIESVGISTCVIAALPPIARQQGAPRIAGAHLPIGSNAGEPNNVEMQTNIIVDTLNNMESGVLNEFGAEILLPYEYHHN